MNCEMDILYPSNIGIDKISRNDGNRLSIASTNISFSYYLGGYLDDSLLCTDELNETGKVREGFMELRA